MNPYSQQCISILPQCKVDSDDRGGLWKVNEFVGTIFSNVKKYFNFLQHNSNQFENVQIQISSIIIQNFNFLLL